MSKTTNKFSPEVCSRAVRLVLEHEHEHEHEHPSRWATTVNKAEVDAGKRPGASTDMTVRMKALERENRELRQANEILRKASAYFAVAELDRRSKT